MCLAGWTAEREGQAGWGSQAQTLAPSVMTYLMTQDNTRATDKKFQYAERVYSTR